MFKVQEKYRDKMKGTAYESDSTYGNNGVFVMTSETTGDFLRIIASDGGGWFHTSVSVKDRTPTWAEMQQVKEAFWGDEDIVVQFHPAKSQYVNCHEFCLHLWQPREGAIPTPPSIMVGAK